MTAPENVMWLAEIGPSDVLTKSPRRRGKAPLRFVFGLRPAAAQTGLEIPWLFVP